MSMSRYLDLYIAESREHLSAIEEELAALAAAPRDTRTLHELFRHAHSIKGMSASMGFPAVAGLSHGIEDALEPLREGREEFSPALRSAVARAFDAVGRMISAIAAREEVAIDTEHLLAELRRFARPAARSSAGAGAPDGAARAVAPPAMLLLRVEVVVDPLAALPAARAAVALKRMEARGRIVRAVPPLAELAAGAFSGRLDVLLDSSHPPEKLASELRRINEIVSVDVTLVRGEPGAPSAQEADIAGSDPAPSSEPALAMAEPSGAPMPPPKSPQPEHGSVDTTVRIPARSLDRFLETIGELIVQRGRLAVRIGASAERATIFELDRLKALVDRLYGDVISLRMLPFEAIAHRFARSVRELSEKEGKSVSLAITGREVLLDRSVLEELVDPINHILRNAIDHGIERPDERAASGKSPYATIAIELERSGDSVAIRISDDGRGMDPARIKAAALRKGFITPERARSIEDHDALMLTTIPGFSTADQVTDLSGRGVGMDVVRTRVERLGGRLRIRMVPEGGTAVEMHLPLTIVVVQAFILEAGGRRWVAPLSSVKRTIEISADALVTRESRHHVKVDDEEIPLYDLATTLGFGSDDRPGLAGREALVSSDRDRLVAFAVDRILGRREVVVRPLGPPLEELRGFSGAAILEDGAIALILDPLNLAQV